MQIKNKIAATVAFALYGATLSWFFAVTGWNSWSSPTTTTRAVLEYAMAIVGGASYGYLFTRDKSVPVQIYAGIAGVVIASVLTWFGHALEVDAWMDHGSAWHAALSGTVTFTLMAVLYFSCPRRS